MAVPTNKSADIEELMTKLNGGKGRRAYIRANKCIKCDGSALYFDSERSRKEYSLSGWCQNCQNEIFNDVETEGM